MPPVVSSGRNHFSRSWLFGAVAPWIYYFIHINLNKHNYFGIWAGVEKAANQLIKLNPWRYTSGEPRPTEAVAATWQYGGALVVSKALVPQP